MARGKESGRATDAVGGDAQLRGKIGANLSFDSGKRRRAGGANEMLRDTIGTIEDIIRKLVNAIGQQQRPINIDAWTAKSGTQRTS